MNDTEHSKEGVTYRQHILRYVSYKYFCQNQCLDVFKDEFDSLNFPMSEEKMYHNAYLTNYTVDSDTKETLSFFLLSKN